MTLSIKNTCKTDFFEESSMFNFSFFDVCISSTNQIISYKKINNQQNKVVKLVLIGPKIREKSIFLYSEVIVGSTKVITK